MASPHHPSPSTIPPPLKFQALSQPYHTILFDCDGVFYRGSNAAERYREGAGLGLPVAQSIAQAHGGNIQLFDRAAGGLKAVLSLPDTDQRENAA